MSQNLPSGIVARYASIIGFMDLGAYYRINGSNRSDVYRVANNGNPADTFYRKGERYKHDPSLHGRITADHSTDEGVTAWYCWSLNQPRTPKAKPAVPERILLSDLEVQEEINAGELSLELVGNDFPEEPTVFEAPQTMSALVYGDIDHSTCDTTCPDKAASLPKPRLADIVKVPNPVVAATPWHVTTRQDLGWFPSRDAARKAIRSL